MERNGELILVSHSDNLILNGRENLHILACALYERGSDECHRDFPDSLKIFFGVKTPELPTVGIAFYSDGSCRKIRMTVVAQFLGK